MFVGVGGRAEGEVMKMDGDKEERLDEGLSY